MNLLYVITRGERAGASLHVRDLLGSFRERFELHLAVGEEEFLAAEARALGVTVHIVQALVRPLRPAKDARAVMSVRDLIAEVRPSLVHAHTFKAGLAGRIAAYLEGVPCVYTPHAWSFLAGTPLAWRLAAVPIEGLMARLGDQVICVSEDELSLARRRRVLPRGKGIVIHNGVADTPLRACPGKSGGAIRMLMVARFAPQKDHETLIRALAGVQQPFELQLVGDGPRRATVANLVRDFDLEEKVFFLGERPDVADLLARAHVFVLSSNWEGLPLVVLEAMRAGLPVVASRVGGVCDAVRHGENGFLFNPRDASQLHEYLVRLIQNARLREQLGVAGRRDYEQHFALPRQIQETLSLYEAVLDGRLTSEPARAVQR